MHDAWLCIYVDNDHIVFCMNTYMHLYACMCTTYIHVRVLCVCMHLVLNVYGCLLVKACMNICECQHSCIYTYTKYIYIYIHTLKALTIVSLHAAAQEPCQGTCGGRRAMWFAGTQCITWTFSCSLWAYWQRNRYFGVHVLAGANFFLRGHEHACVCAHLF